MVFKETGVLQILGVSQALSFLQALSVLLSSSSVSLKTPGAHRITDSVTVF